MKKKIILLMPFLFSIMLSAQESTRNRTGLEPFYSYAEASESTFANNLSKNESFSDDDINSSFSNIEDLTFLKEVAIKNKIILMGETHYATNIYNLRNRILFAINTYDYYPLIIIEQPYSLVEYFNYYIHIENDGKADLFLKNELSPLIPTEEDIVLLKHLRKWNRLRKDKPLSIGGTDLEFAYQTTINNILIPYFYKIGRISKEQIDEIKTAGNDLNEGFFTLTEELLKQARNENVTGKYSFITIQYICNIIRNLHDTYDALNGNFDYSRQHSIIRKLTNDDYFGKIVKEQKVMLHGGGEHMKSRFELPAHSDFYSEGIYLNHTLPETKGKVYSIMAESFAYTYGDMKNRKLENCIRQGRQYRDMIGKFENAKEEINNAIPYILYGKKNDFLKQISIYYYHNHSVSFTDSQICKIYERNLSHDDTTNAFIHKLTQTMRWYDKYIFILASKTATARLK